MNWVLVLSLPDKELFSFSRGMAVAKQRRVSMDTPVAIGMAATFIVSSGVAFGDTATFGDTPTL